MNHNVFILFQYFLFNSEIIIVQFVKVIGIFMDIFISSLMSICS